MQTKSVIQVFEHEWLLFNDYKELQKRHIDALLQFNDNHHNKYLQVGRKGVKFRQYVGVLQVGNITIEILPKTDNSGDKNKWRDVLLKMLKECRLLKTEYLDHAFLQLRSNSLLEIYLGLFLNRVERLVHEGLIKKYAKWEGNQLTLKGQLLFGKNISNNFVHQERFYVRYTEYSYTNCLNQLLYKTLHLFPLMTNNPNLLNGANRLLLHFPEMPDCKVNESTFEKLVFDRKSERYKEALTISKMLLLNFWPDIKGGAENVIAILFDMNKLWEEFVFRRLQRAADAGTIVTRQQKKFWYNNSMGKYKWVIPDIVVQRGGRTVILDTKWKIIKDNTPSDDDLKQMFVYNLFFNAERSYLVYPGSNETSSGSYLHFDLSYPKRRNDDEEFYNHCSLLFLDLLNEEGKLVGVEVFDRLLKKI
jgi:McrBC 5-methylcytosine restriction system component